MYSAYVHSPTLNEPGHLVAGLSHWEFGRFELYRVNPPLVRMVAALPVMAVGYEADWSGFYEGPGARPVFGMGEDFVAANGERTFFLTMIARWACLPFSWLGAIVCYLWGRDLFGRPAGLIACFLWCFEPNVLAHASLYTADAHAAALGLAACYTFWRWLKNPTWTHAALTGVLLGLAELAKTTLILFYPLWPLMWLAYRWRDRASMTLPAWGREAGMLALRMAIGLYIVNLGYGFEGSFKPLGEFHFVSHLFTGNADDDASQGLPSVNRFRDTSLSLLPVPFPKNYLLGIDIQQRDFEDYARPFYLRGEWRDEGWWYYYLYAALVKVPLGVWALGALTLATTFLTRRNPNLGDELVLLFPAAVIFTVVSSKTGINEHFRYVLPCFPFVFVWLAGAAERLFSKKHRKTIDFARGSVLFEGNATLSANTLLWFFATSILLFWTATSSLWIYPHSLSYFNETIEGPSNGARYILGSNIDWGQDLKYLQRHFAEQRSEVFHLAYHGGFDPVSAEITGLTPWPQTVPSFPNKAKCVVSVNIASGDCVAGWQGFGKTVDSRQIVELMGPVRSWRIKQATYALWVLEVETLNRTDR
ncbi:MAG: glycosyltransferase family 39 protein [Pseudomonadota bacterium]